MTHAVFNAAGRALIQFDDDTTVCGSLELAEQALATTYRRTAGTYVDVLCVEHDDEPKGSCSGCEAKASCPACADGRPCTDVSH
ncbi:hypothetical protein LG634_24725 [Streptomyces bambusae]|uniref:hypothetical protein n=1 Tax=Streptomyces bambusae TaxID=1550616 RepID=UPI001CFF3C44|nr:hypothetical protein [Streptomyces bambusae]MCB5168018.1 hypothetical protein [Streptomyces bambusae]